MQLFFGAKMNALRPDLRIEGFGSLSNGMFIALVLLMPAAAAAISGARRKISLSIPLF